MLATVTSDESVCGGLVKTTRTLPILRLLLERRLALERDATTQEPLVSSSSQDVRDAVRVALTSCLPMTAKILRYLVVNSHSRRAFSGFLPQHRASAFLQLLLSDDTFNDAAHILIHVLLYSQDAKEILDQLVLPVEEGGGGLLDTLRQICHNAVVVRTCSPDCSVQNELPLLTATVAMLSAVVSVTPRPHDAVLDVVRELYTFAIAPLLSERTELWVGLLTSTIPVTHHPLPIGRRQMQLAVALEPLITLNEEALHLATVLRLELLQQQLPIAADPLSQAVTSLLNVWAETDVAVDEQLIVLWESCCSVIDPSYVFGSALAAISHRHAHSGIQPHLLVAPSTSCQPELILHAVRRNRVHLQTIRKHNLDAKAVQHALLEMLHDVQAGGGASSSPARGYGERRGSVTVGGVAEAYACALGRMAGGIKTLVGTLSTVDEEVSSLSCAVLIAVLRSAPPLHKNSTGNSSSHATACLLDPDDDDEACGTTTASVVISASLNIDADEETLAERRRNPIHQFAALDGILLLSDMLDDYSDDVLSGAVGLLAAVSSSPRALREMEQHDVLRKVRGLMQSIGDRRMNASFVAAKLLPPSALVEPAAASSTTGAATAAGDHESIASMGGVSSAASDADDDVRRLIPLATLCCDSICRLPPPALRQLFPQRDILQTILSSWWHHVHSAVVSTETPAAASTVFPLLSPFARLLCNISRVFGRRVVSGVIALVDSAGRPWMGVWTQVALRNGGVGAAVALATGLIRLLQEVSTFSLKATNSNNNHPHNPNPSTATASTDVAIVPSMLASLHDMACTIFLIPFDQPQQQMMVLQSFWVLVSEVMQVASRDVIDGLRSSLYESLLGSMRVVTANGAGSSFVAAALDAMVTILSAWGLAHQDEVVQMLGVVAVHPEATLQSRTMSAQLLMGLLCSAVSSGSHAASTHVSAVTSTISKETKSSLALLWTKIILLCEDAVDETDAQLQQHNSNDDRLPRRRLRPESAAAAAAAAASYTALANVSFNTLVQDGAEYIVVLVRAALVVLDSMLYMDPAALAAHPIDLPWLGRVADADDAHDILVALVPLINGVLSQSPSCRLRVVPPMTQQQQDNNAQYAQQEDGDQQQQGVMYFFVRLISCGESLEVPLKVLGIYALWHCLDLPTLSPAAATTAATGGEGVSFTSSSSNNTAAVVTPTHETQVALQLRSWNIFLVLSHIQREAQDSQQPPEALTEIRTACALLAERLLLLSPPAACGGPHPGDVWQFVQSSILPYAAQESQACSLLLTILQDDDSRMYLRSDPTYEPVLVSLRASLRDELLPPGVSDQAGTVASMSVDVGQHNSQAYYALLQVEKYIAEL